MSVSFVKPSRIAKIQLSFHQFLTKKLRREEKTGWQDGRMAGWQDGRMAGWQDGRMAGWQDGRMEEREKTS
jgi:hypothetical protein